MGDGGRVLQDSLELGQQVVRRDDVRRLGLVDPVHHRILPQVGVDRAEGETLFVVQWRFESHLPKGHTGISSEVGTKLRDWASWQARAGCYSQAALSSND